MKGRSDLPSMRSGVSIPAMSRIVGARSMLRATALDVVPPVIPGPRISIGILRFGIIVYFRHLHTMNGVTLIPDIILIHLPLVDRHSELPQVVTVV